MVEIVVSNVAPFSLFTICPIPVRVKQSVAPCFYINYSISSSISGNNCKVLFVHLQNSANNRKKRLLRLVYICCSISKQPIVGYRCLRFSTLTNYSDCIFG